MTCIGWKSGFTDLPHQQWNTSSFIHK